MGDSNAFEEKKWYDLEWSLFASSRSFEEGTGMFLSTSRTYAYWDGTSVGLLGSFSDVDVRTPNRLPGHLV